MATLEIRKLSTKTWKHIDTNDGAFILTKFYAKEEFNEFLIVESYGAKRRKYLINEIEVYDIGGTAETFANFEDLFLRLEALKYTGFYKDGDIDLDLKLDKVTTAGVERVYTINPDGSQGTKPTSNLKDVINGYFNGTNFYTDALFTNLITPESGKIYINIAVTPATQYRWSGSGYVLISDLENGIYNNEGQLNVNNYQTTFQNINYIEGIVTSGSATNVNVIFIKYTSTAQTNALFGYRGNIGITSRSNSNKRYVFWFSKGEVIPGNFLSVGCHGGSGLFVPNFGPLGVEFGHGASDINFKVCINGVFFDLGVEFPISTDFYRVSFLFRDGNVICDVKNMTNGKKISITHSVPTNVIIGAVHLSGGTLNTSTAASLLINRIKIINYEN